MRAVLALIAALVLAAPAQAQDWPQKPVTIVVPFAAGGSADLLARILQQHMQAKFGVPFVVENRSGAGGSGKHGDPTVIPAKNFTLSIMYVEPGQGNAAHTHEVEECFFVLQGYLDVFVEDESGKRLTTRLGPWECISCPAGVIHGYQNDSLGPVYFQVMIGRAKPETMGYADEDLYKKRDAHLKAV